MAFQTPQTGGKGEPFTSLLFTPKTGDGATKTVPDYRTPRAKSPASAFGGMSRFAARDSTPQRRRSLTPASSMARDTPPPPPMDSLLDTTEGGASLTLWQPQQGEASGAEDMVVSTSPLVAAQQHMQQQQELAWASHQLEQHEDTWVTVFGFGHDDLPLVLREFGKCGTIVTFGTFWEGQGVNWVHLNYSNKYGAQRALLRSGDQLSHGIMVGVVPLSPQHKQAVQRYLQGGGAGGGAGAGGYAMPCPKPPAMRPYAIDASNAQASVVPLPSRTFWSKASEFIFGL